MAGKISKSDTTPEMEAKAEEYRLAMLKKQCLHFAVGTWIMYNNIRGEILDRYQWDGTTYLLVQWEDGSVSRTEPIALNH
jgi:hypothetical protein